MSKAPYIRTKYVDRGIDALRASIDAYNRVLAEYRREQSLILLSNSIELLGKAVLLKLGQNIYVDRSRRDTLPAEKIISKLLHMREVEEIESMTLQQIVSLRNAASHSVLPNVHDDIMQHLMFGGYKTLSRLIKKHFKNKEINIGKNFLSISSDIQLTYADRVEGLLKNFQKRTVDEKSLAWLLGRGVAFNGTRYITQGEFERQLTSGTRRNILDRSELGTYIKGAEQLQVVLVQAPKGYSVDLEIRKGSRKSKEALPVMIKKTDPNKDFPFFTSDLADKTGKSANFVARAMKRLGLKDNPELCSQVKVSRTGSGIPKYNQAALEALQKLLQQNGNYNPWGS